MSHISKIDDILHGHLDYHLKKACHYGPFQEALDYSALPAGKLFRPKLVCAFYADFGHDLELMIKNPNDPLSLLCCSLELHHAYTLVHDDLPSMDDDDMRRGKASVHKHYSEWQAILAGDALLHLSHQLMTKIEHPHSKKLHQAFSWALGARGLILGQVFDLDGEITKDFPSLIRTHELKTARLIQTSLLGAGMLATSSYDLNAYKTALRLGMNIGISFQLLDDLSECTSELSTHEKEVSPFLNFPEMAFERLESSLKILKSYQESYPQTHKYLSHYLLTMKNKIVPSLESKESLLYKNLGKDRINKRLLPVMTLL